MIIDVHVHIGHDTTFESNRTEDEIMQKMNQVGITAAICQPAQFVTFDEYRVAHNRIYDFHLKHPKKIFGMFSMNPHFEPTLYKTEARRCVHELGFVGIKLTPLTHTMNAAVARARLPFEMCRELGVTLMIHQGNGLPFSFSSSYFNLIKEFSDVTVVLAHCGAMDNEDECIVLAQELSNVYLDCSVRTPNQRNLKRFIREVGTERMLYASDSPDEMAHVLWEFSNIDLNKHELENALYYNAIKAFHLEGKV